MFDFLGCVGGILLRTLGYSILAIILLLIEFSIRKTLVFIASLIFFYIVFKYHSGIDYHLSLLSLILPFVILRSQGKEFLERGGKIVN